jgi:TatD DNase family protein
MPITYIDTHAHLFSNQFDIDLDEVVNRSLAADVTKVLLPNIDLDSVGRMFSICDQYPDFFAPMVGLHPCSVTANYKEVLEELLPYLFDPRVVAVGEMGTDLYWDQSLIAEQIEAFKIQCQWAKESNLPIVIHCRDSMDLTIELVRGLQNGHLRGVFHCFGGTLNQAKEIIDLGFMLGIGGVVTFKKSIELREVLSQVPISSLLLETDSPYLAPHPYRGKRNESSYIPLISEIIAIAKEVDISDISNATTNNAKRLFNI